jgi:endonuclease/exonuclease/phosphatase family metal-dependent hydrolase
MQRTVQYCLNMFKDFANFLLSQLCRKFKTFMLVIFSMLSVVCIFSGYAGEVDKIVVATWNVENLFDTVLNQSGGADAEFTPKSWRRWTPERYNQKIDNLAWVISRINPDVICLQEVENEDVARELMDRIQSSHGLGLGYLAHVDSKDRRGIDNAIISRYPISGIRYSPDGYTRGTLVADVEIDNTAITFFVCHWKSQSGEAAENIAIRTRQALAVRKNVLKYLKKNPSASVVIAGDFNENFDDVSLVKTFEAVTERKESAGTAGDSIKFYNLISDIPPDERGSYYYARRKVWNTFDSIIVSPMMLISPENPGPDWRVSTIESGVTKVFALPEMQEEDGRPKAYRRVRIKGKPDNYYVDGYSDHFPIVTTLLRGVPEDSKKRGQK